MKKIIIIVVLIAALSYIYTQYQSAKTTNEKNISEKKNLVEKLEAGEYVLLDNQKVSWKGSALLKSHEGTIDLSSSMISVTDSGFINSSSVLDMNTISGDAGEGLDGHLKSADFFDVENNKSGSFSFASEDGITFAAKLELKGLEHSISFNPVITKGSEEGTINIKADLEFDRTLWGVNYGSESALGELKDKAISDDVLVSIDLNYKKTTK